MALTYTGARNLFGVLTGLSSSAQLATGDILINEGYRDLIGSTNWPFLEDQYTTTTTASTQFYNLPGDYRKLDTISITNGTTVYTPLEITSRRDWDYVNSNTAVTSNVPSYYYIFAGRVGFWPVPSSSSLTITVNYRKGAKDISIADYTTGSIVSITSGALAVVGTGTTWTSKMIGRFIRITNSDTANTGDGNWYQISAVGSTTSLTLSRPYEGPTIAAGTAAYTIGDCMLIPEDYQKLPVYYAAGIYWLKEDSGRADKFMQVYENGKAQMLTDLGNKTTDPTVDDGITHDEINPNLTIWAT